MQLFGLYSINLAILNIGINGFGRIGRMVLRELLLRPNVVVRAINDLTDTATLAHLFKYDSVHGRFAGDVRHDEGHLYIDGRVIRVLSEQDPLMLPWRELEIDLVIESKGTFTMHTDAETHLRA